MQRSVAPRAERVQPSNVQRCPPPCALQRGCAQVCSRIKSEEGQQEVEAAGEAPRASCSSCRCGSRVQRTHRCTLRTLRAPLKLAGLRCASARAAWRYDEKGEGRMSIGAGEVAVAALLAAYLAATMRDAAVCGAARTLGAALDDAAPPAAVRLAVLRAALCALGAPREAAATAAAVGDAEARVPLRALVAAWR